MNSSTAAVLVLLGAGGGFLLSRVCPPAQPERSEETVERLAVVEAENARLRAEAAATREGARGLQGAPTTTPEPGATGSRPDPETAAAPTPATTGTTEKKAKGAPRLSFEGFEEALAETDWAVVGDNVHQMVPLLGPFAEEFAKTGERPADLTGRIAQLNGPLLGNAMKSAKKMGYTDLSQVNQAFTHPVFQANMIAAALAAAGRPLTDGQAAAIRDLAERFVDRDRARLAGYAPQAFALQKALDESGLREQFFTEAFAVLTQEQRDVLQPAVTKGRLAIDLFSSALGWATRAQALPVRDREGLAADMERTAFQAIGLPETARPAVHDAVLEWAQSWPRETIEGPVDLLSTKGMIPLPVVVEAARRQLTLFQRMIDLGSFDEATAAKLRAFEFVLVPVRSAAP